MNEILIILENIQSQLGGKLEHITPYNILNIPLKNANQGDVYVEIRDETGDGIIIKTPQIWVWTITEERRKRKPSLIIDLSSPEAIEKVVKHVKDYLAVQAVANLTN